MQFQTVKLTIYKREITLTPTIDAVMKISERLGGVIPAVMQVKQMNLKAIVVLIDSSTADLTQEERRTLADEVYNNCWHEAWVAAIQIADLLARGGKATTTKGELQNETALVAPKRPAHRKGKT